MLKLCLNVIVLVSCFLIIFIFVIDISGLMYDDSEVGRLKIDIVVEVFECLVIDI